MGAFEAVDGIDAGGFETFCLGARFADVTSQ
jgi:hypothetical protein